MSLWSNLKYIFKYYPGGLLKCFMDLDFATKGSFFFSNIFIKDNFSTITTKKFYIILNRTNFHFFNFSFMVSYKIIASGFFREFLKSLYSCDIFFFNK